MNHLGQRIARLLEGATFERVAASGLANAEANQSRINRSVLDLKGERLGEGDAALVVAAGPSLRRRRSLERLRKIGFGGTVVAADGALGACLRAGVVPHVVVSVDPHRGRIVRWFGDPTLTTVPADDYFRRQEMDVAHGHDELGVNRTLVELVNRHGPEIRGAVATSAAPEVTARCAEAGMALYWWNPMYDDYDAAESLSRRLHRMNGLPCINGGGNVGTAAWVLAHAVLGKRRVGVVGMDFSYTPDTPYEKTQYYPELVELLGDGFKDAFIHMENPAMGETWFTDPAYYWYREVFLQMAANAGCQTYNCTEGGLLFGPDIRTMSLEEFVQSVQGGC